MIITQINTNIGEIIFRTLSLSNTQNSTQHCSTPVQYAHKQMSRNIGEMNNFSPTDFQSFSNTQYHLQRDIF